MVVTVHLPIWIAALVAIAIAVALGAAIGLIRDAFNVPTFIGTLALYLSLRGVALLVTNTFPIPGDSSKFFYWGTGKVFGSIPVPAVYFFLMFIVVAVIAKMTVFGRSVYAVGGNPKAAAPSDTSVRKVKILVMCGTAFTAAITVCCKRRIWERVTAPSRTG